MNFPPPAGAGVVVGATGATSGVVAGVACVVFAAGACGDPSPEAAPFPRRQGGLPV